MFWGSDCTEISNMDTERNLVCAIDQGTSSSRLLVFDSKTAELVTLHQTEIKQYFPHTGWVEQDATEILESVKTCIDKCAQDLQEKDLLNRVKAIGVANQRLTIVAWDKFTGKPLHKTVTWMDSRTASICDEFEKKQPHEKFVQSRSGLPISHVFSAPKIVWLLRNSPEVSKAVGEGRCMMGNVDTWLIWNLTGGPQGGVYVTDPSNAGGTMLMNLDKLEWDPDVHEFFGIPTELMPSIKSSSEIYGHMAVTLLKGVPISGDLGDTMGGLVGQQCFESGQAKMTYGTAGCLTVNVGPSFSAPKGPVMGQVGYQIGPGNTTYYILEGVMAYAGFSVRWLRDNLGIIKTSQEIEELAFSVDDPHGCYFVPAFSGLLVPHWQADARGMIIGLSQFTTKAHVARAALEAVCFRTREALEGVNAELGSDITSLRVDGGMAVNTPFLQLLADIMGIDVVRPTITESTALGAAMVAGAAVGVWDLDNKENLPNLGGEIFSPKKPQNWRDEKFARWKEALKRSFHWETAYAQ